MDCLINLISEKSGIADSIKHNIRKIRIDSYKYLPTKNIDFSKCYNSH